MLISVQCPLVWYSNEDFNVVSNKISRRWASYCSSKWDFRWQDMCFNSWSSSSFSNYFLFLYEINRRDNVIRDTSIASYSFSKLIRILASSDVVLRGICKSILQLTIKSMSTSSAKHLMTHNLLNVGGTHKQTALTVFQSRQSQWQYGIEIIVLHSFLGCSKIFNSSKL